jgi:hypothetical protein
MRYLIDGVQDFEDVTGIEPQMEICPCGGAAVHGAPTCPSDNSCRLTICSRCDELSGPYGC